MLSQTNLQLYSQLARLGWTSADLACVRRGYDLACELFASAYRPSHKPFVCHLIGTASAAAAWGARPAVVVAGLLHSAYLYGDFGDGEVGASPRRRRYVRQLVGGDAETLVWRYTAGEGAASLEASPAAPHGAEVRLLQFADLLDELTDAGPRYSPRKGVGRMLADTDQREAIAAEAERVAGAPAAADLRAAFAVFDAAVVDASLVTNAASYHRVAGGCEALRRTRLQRRVVRMTHKIFAKDAA